MALSGLLDQSTLAAVPGGQLRLDAAVSYVRWRTEMKARGFTFEPTGPYDTYRPYKVQEKIFRERYSLTVTGIDPRGWDSDGNGIKETWWRRPGTYAAAVPGQSNHGWGTAVDIAYVTSFTTRKYAAMSETGPKHGWTNTEGRSVSEPWHWVYNRTLDTFPTTPVPEEDDMPYTPDELAGIAQRGAHQAVYNLWREPEIQNILRAMVREVVREEIVNRAVARAGSTTWFLDDVEGNTASIETRAELRAFIAAHNAATGTTVDMDALADAILARLNLRQLPR